MTHTPESVAELVDALPYIASILDARQSRFADADHITVKASKIRQAAATLTTLSRRVEELEAALNAQHTCCGCDKVFSGAGQGAYICNGCAGAD